MDRLPRFSLPSSPQSRDEANDSNVDVSFYDGRFTCMRESGVLPRQLQYHYYDYLPMCSHGGSPEDFHALPLIDARVGETSSNHSSEGSPYNPFLTLNHWQHNYPMIAEYPDCDTHTAPAGDLTHESTQNDWKTPSVDIHAPPAQFIPFLPPPSVPLPLPMQLGGQDVQHEMYCCPLLASNGTRCDTSVPCEEAQITTHLRGVHGLRAKRLEVIDCPWPGCSKRNQAASIPRHIITLHVKKRFQCSYCGKSLTRKDGKAKHERICLENPINATDLSFM